MSTNPTAVLIDDDYGPMSYFVEALRMQELDVTHIATTDAALDWIADGKNAEPNIFIVDVMMPHGRLPAEETDSGLKTGYHIMREIVKRYPNAPIVCLTNINHAEQTAAEIALFADRGIKHIAKFETAPFAFAKTVKDMIQQERL